MENIATKQPQQTPNILQEISKLPPIALVVTVILGFCALGLLPLYAAAMLIGLSWWGLTAIERAQALKGSKGAGGNIRQLYRADCGVKYSP
jgi:hypothetical protein